MPHIYDSPEKNKNKPVRLIEYLEFCLEDGINWEESFMVYYVPGNVHISFLIISINSQIKEKNYYSFHFIYEEPVTQSCSLTCQDHR